MLDASSSFLISFSPSNSPSNANSSKIISYKLYPEIICRSTEDEKDIKWIVTTDNYCEIKENKEFFLKYRCWIRQISCFIASNLILFIVLYAFYTQKVNFFLKKTEEKQFEVQSGRYYHIHPPNPCKI